MASVNERLFDANVSHALDLMRLEAGERQKARSLLRKMERDLVAQIARIDPTEPLRSRYKEERLGKLLKQARETIRTSYRDVSATVQGELLELADIEQQWAVRSINRAAGITLADAAMTRGQLRSIVSDVLIKGARSSEWWSRQAGDTMYRFADQMRQGMALGETMQQLVRRVRGGMQDGLPVQGIMDISRRHAEALVRASVGAVSADTRMKVYRENADIVDYLQWVSTMDDRVTVLCAVRDGKLYTLDGEPVGHDIPWLEGPRKLHWGCRSDPVPVLKSAEEIFGRGVGDLPPGTRATMDGQVSATQTFEEWIGKQSKSRQDTVLGAGRADLWREGKISFRDLIDQRGRELTLEELRKRI